MSSKDRPDRGRAIGEKRETKESLESGEGVEEVMPILAPYKVASLEVKPELLW